MARVITSGSVSKAGRPVLGGCEECSSFHQSSTNTYNETKKESRSSMAPSFGESLVHQHTILAPSPFFAITHQTSEECQAEINDLRVATEAAKSSFTNDKDQASLLGKVESASTKLSRGKTADALINLNSFLTKVNTLNAEGKLAEGAASEALTVEGSQARDCVAGLLQEQAPTAIA